MLDACTTIVDCSGDLIRLALAEDLGERGDVTSLATLTSGKRAMARIHARTEGVLAGLPLVARVFRELDAEVRVRLTRSDGEQVAAGEMLCEIEGRAVTLLGAERTALNFLQHLSGIATLTRRYVDAVAGTGATILDTRKTTPGWRRLEKYAVRMGGGSNHRLGLHDALLIKENHIAAAGGITAALLRVRACSAAEGLPVIIEVERLPQLDEALGLAPQRILLDNMSLGDLREAVVRSDGRVPLEASGNMTLERVPAVAATGVDFISVGALTHSAPVLDCSMRILTNGETLWTN
ncbi:MAG: carboxylating nicotinate-nucleotide diphosphorylase [Anaerolineaceae bacterium]|nr:carboxylating nicotinate-nucleotide diphosphorylase [Anaerolineaceae bacterium]MDE0329499.1 carboxylating nicotinate-nucleotide diphosphorylase [Anaerolineaceae bacterium]